MECFWCSLDHIIYCYSTKDKIMQITFLSNDLAFLPFSCNSIAVIAVFRENCLACFFDGVIFPENHGNLRGIKSPAMQLGWNCTDSLLLNMLNGSLMMPTVTSSQYCSHFAKLEVLQSFYQFSVRPTVLKKESVICKWICPRFSQIFLVTEVHLGTSQ